MKIAIAAATGNIGSRVARAVAAGGATPVLLGRDRAKLTALGIDRATISITDVSDADQVTAATKGCDALLWLVPPVSHVANLADWYRRVTEAGVTAVSRNGIKRVLLVSSLGAGAAENLGTISFIGDTEQAFNALTTNVLTLRPGYFMENFLLQTQSLLEQGVFHFTYDPEHDIPFISTDDIGDAAARYLLDPTWAGHWTLNLMGPENITLREVAVRLSNALGHPIRYERLALEAVHDQLRHAGLTDTVQQELLDLFVALGDPNGAYATPRTPEAYTSTRLEEFAQTKLAPLLADAVG
jgi:uncharacterized protein YbjT (DUF2867 family)